MKLVIFTVADKEYALSIQQVREVIRLREITTIPEAPGFVEGVINLRGKVTPLINLRKKFGIPGIELSKLNRVIITQMNGHIVGIIVDQVEGVTTIENDHIESPNQVLKEAAYLTGVAKIGKRLILMVDAEKILSGAERTNIQQVQNKVEIKNKM